MLVGYSLPLKISHGRRGLKEHEEPVSCTSRLCSWNAPRHVQVDPKPVDDIVITKYRFWQGN